MERNLLKKTFILQWLCLFLLYFGVATEGHAQAKADSVYITDTGAKYHAATCRYLKYSAIKVAKADAINDGYTSCKVCGGTAIGNSKYVPASAGHGSSNTKATSSGQCTATTQKGTRCKRSASAGASRCWQH
jgi:hypothetical protein